MELLIVAFLAFLAFVAWAPKESMQLVLAVAWGGMALSAVGSIGYAILRVMLT